MKTLTFDNNAGANIVSNGLFISTYKRDCTPTAAGGILAGDLEKVIWIYLTSPIDITAVPQIAAGYNGQEITIVGYNDTNTLKIDNGNGVILAGGVSCTLGEDDTLTLIYTTRFSSWIEVSRSNN